MIQDYVENLENLENSGSELQKAIVAQCAYFPVHEAQCLHQEEKPLSDGGLVMLITHAVRYIKET